MIDIKKIKTSILSFAFRGELVDFPDKTKKNLDLEKIHNENKKYSAVKNDEWLILPPKHWNWTRLAYITSNHGQITPLETFCYIDVGTMDNVHQKLSKLENIVEAKDAPSRARKVVEFGDVLYSTVRPYLHNVCIVDKKFSKTPIASTAFCVMKVNEDVLLNKFLFYWLISAEFDRFANGNPSKGTLYPAIGEKDLLNGVIPLPSINEQQEIVAKIDEVFNALDDLDYIQMRYLADIEALKTKIIDAGIRGNLTEQLPEDGTAEELYTKIQEEKAALMQGGKIKKEKALPEIAETEIPFDIPQNWKWIRLGDISVKISSGNTPAGGNKSNAYVEKGYSFFREQNIYNDGIHEEGLVYITEELLKARENSTVMPMDILLNITGGSIGRCALVPDDFTKGSINQHILIIRMIDPRLRFYIHTCICSPSIQKYIKGNTVGDKDGFSAGRCKNMLIPLPPYAEQIRIVEKIREVISCGQIMHLK